MLPPPPPRLSTTTGCPQSWDSRVPNRRATTSFDPPAGNGTTILTPRSGNSACAACPINDPMTRADSTEMRYRIRGLQIIDFYDFLDFKLTAIGAVVKSAGIMLCHYG